MSAIGLALLGVNGKRRTGAALTSAAARLECSVSALTAITIVESNGSGFDKQGRVKVLFEKHKFYKHVPDAKRAAAVKAGLARKEWIRAKEGGYRDQPTNGAALELLIRAMAVDEVAALKSASYGMGQVLGENFGVCGWPSVQAFVLDMIASEDNQIAAIIGFVEGNGLADEVRDLDFDAIARVYNGPGQVTLYGGRMRAEYQKLEGAHAKTVSPIRATALRLGSSGYRVEALQRRLTELGYPVAVDGDFGTATRRAVVAFQVDNALEIDGVVATKTQAALDVAKSAVAADRAGATVADLRASGSGIVKQADNAEGIAKLGFGVASLTGLAKSGILESVKDTADSVSGLGPIVQPAIDLLTMAASNVWIVMGIGGLALWYFARKIKADRLRDHQTGKTV